MTRVIWEDNQRADSLPEMEAKSNYCMYWLVKFVSIFFFFLCSNKKCTKRYILNSNLTAYFQVIVYDNMIIIRSNTQHLSFDMKRIKYDASKPFLTKIQIWNFDGNMLWRKCEGYKGDKSKEMWCPRKHSPQKQCPQLPLWAVAWPLPLPLPLSLGPTLHWSCAYLNPTFLMPVLVISPTLQTQFFKFQKKSKLLCRNFH